MIIKWYQFFKSLFRIQYHHTTLFTMNELYTNRFNYLWKVIGSSPGDFIHAVQRHNFLNNCWFVIVPASTSRFPLDIPTGTKPPNCVIGLALSARTFVSPNVWLSIEEAGISYSWWIAIYYLWLMFLGTDVARVANVWQRTDLNYRDNLTIYW